MTSSTNNKQNFLLHDFLVHARAIGGVSLLGACFLLAGIFSATYGFQFACSLIDMTPEVTAVAVQKEDFDIPSHTISNAYLIESIIQELPEVEPQTSDNFSPSLFASQSDSFDLENGGMGGAITLSRSIISSKNASLNSSSSLMHKIRNTAPKTSEFDVNGFKYIDTMQKRISRIPIGSPAIGRITSTYGRRKSPFRPGGRDLHTGIDIAVDQGTPVHASADGKIVYAERKGGYGKAILIRHPSGYETLYAHLSDLLVEEGQSVCRGQQIGFVGTTGRSTGPHLHYEIRENGTPIDPAPFIELAHILRFAK